jgi:hypothetical protein
LSSCLLSKSIKIKIYKTLVLLVVLYGFENWFLTLKNEHRLRVSENRVLRRIFVPKGDKVTGGWRKLHSEELHIMCSLPNIIRMIKSKADEIGGACGTHASNEKCIQNFGGIA